MTVQTPSASSLVLGDIATRRHLAAGDNRGKGSVVRREDAPSRGDCPGKRHGTASAANNDGCICPDAHAARRRQWKAAWVRRQRGERRPPRRERVPAWVDATGTRRRLEALARLGWSTREIARRLGYGERSNPPWFYASRLHRRNAEKLAALYDELSMTLGPCDRTRRRAERLGWASPLAWDDDAIDDPDAKPDAGRLPRWWRQDARRENEAFLRAMGESDELIAARLGVTVFALDRMRCRDEAAS